MDEPGSIAGAAPVAEVALPGGQHLRAAVTRRRRDRSGAWWYDLELEIPDREDDRRHGPRLVTRTLTFSAPHPVVQPVDGEDYRSLDPPPPQERKGGSWMTHPCGSGRNFSSTGPTARRPAATAS
ncbi:hypothetical protein WKI65_38880 [Streptomyces sp. MS1.AVA.3]|uniref:hypothetical protein n=1 Tax=Streptomyces decoyicus TaxID=249567 RepID=UPI0030BD5796